MTYLPRPLLLPNKWHSDSMWSSFHTTTPISYHERARHETAATSLQIMLTIKPDRLTEEEAGGGDK